MPATFTVVSDTEILTEVLFGALTEPLSVGTTYGTAVCSVDFRVQPGISDFRPSSGPMGTVVTIRGTAFTEATAVSFNGVAASFRVDSYGKIRAIVQAGAAVPSRPVLAPSDRVIGDRGEVVQPIGPEDPPGNEDPACAGAHDDVVCPVVQARRARVTSPP